MTFKQALKFCLSQKGYANFQGRASRSEFWWFALFVFMVYFVFFVAHFILVFEYKDNFILFSIINICLLMPIISVCVRRLHDLNLSGLISLILFLTPWIFLIIFFLYGLFMLSYHQIDGLKLQNLGVNLLCIYIIIIIIFAILFTKKGTKGVNCFGKDPLEKDNTLTSTLKLE